MARLKDKYVSEIAPALMSKFGYKSVMQIPKLDKVVVNVGCGDAKDNPKMMDAILGDIATVTGQRPVVCRAKKSVANFKLREGMPIGVKVTLRGERMYEFVDRLFSVALPRVRDFRGINGNSFDGRGVLPSKATRTTKARNVIPTIRKSFRLPCGLSASILLLSSSRGALSTPPQRSG